MLKNLKPETRNVEQPLSWAESFCALNLVGAAIVFGIIFCLYWNQMVLSQFLPSGTYPLILLIVFYLPAGILALVCGFAWFAAVRFVFKCFGVKFSD